MCFQDEVKQLSSWKFFDWYGVGNRFGNDVCRLKIPQGRLRTKVIRVDFSLIFCPSSIQIANLT